MGREFMECPSEDFADPVLLTLDYDAQFAAIRRLLYRQANSDDELEAEISKAEDVARRARGLTNEYAVAEWVGLLQDSCYQDAAHSMAAVGMIAPFIESVFKQAFQHIGKELPRGNLATNIMDRAREVGMAKYMPGDLEPVLSALFVYRNKMFHCGFEWPCKERKRFQTLLDKSEWPSGWFLKATFDDEPWMFYMSPEFINHCLDRIQQVIEGIESFGIEWSLTVHGTPSQ